MSEDYASAAVRHWLDAEQWRLYSPDNAAYLAGYAIECSYKAVVGALPGPSGQALGHDIVLLGGDALDFAVMLTPGADRYVATSKCLDFAQQRWEPAWRYEATGARTTSDAATMAQAAREAVAATVHALILDGRLGST